MKRNVKIILLVYLGIAIFTYALTLRVKQLETKGYTGTEKESIVLRIR